MTVYLRISKSRITVGDVIRAEEGIRTNAAMVDFLTKFVTDADGNYLPPAQAREELLALTLEELPGVVSQLAEGIRALTAGAVPLVTSAP